MRAFEQVGIDIFEPVKVLVIDDELELPDNLDELTVYFFDEEDSSGTRPVYRVYREGDSMVCFATEEGVRQKSPDSFWSARLRFLILSCQQQRLTQLIVR